MIEAPQVYDDTIKSILEAGGAFSLGYSPFFASPLATSDLKGNDFFLTAE